MFQHGEVTYGDDGKLYDEDGNLITDLHRPDGTSYPIKYEKGRVKKKPSRARVAICVKLLILNSLQIT